MSLTDLLPLVALVAAIGLVVLFALTTRAAVAATSHAEEVRRRRLRLAEMRAEAARLAAIRSETVAGAVDIGSAVARIGHETVAGLSFKVLDVATRGRTRRIKHRHDSIAKAVYGAISEATEEMRSRGERGGPSGPGTPPPPRLGPASPPPRLGPASPED